MKEETQTTPLNVSIPWEEIELAYANGGETYKSLSIRYGVSENTIEKRGCKFKWRKQSKEAIIKRVEERTTELVVKTLAEERIKEIQLHEKRTGEIAKQLLEGIPTSFEQMAPAADPLAIMQLSSSLQKLQTVSRLNLGLPSSIGAIDITSGGMSLHDSALQALKTAKIMVADGRLSSKDINLNELVEARRLSELNKSK